MPWHRQETRDGGGRRCVADIYFPETWERDQCRSFRLVRYLNDSEHYDPALEQSSKPAPAPAKYAGMTEQEYNQLRADTLAGLERWNRGEVD